MGRRVGPIQLSLAALVLVACVVIPYLSWHGTWFGRPLDDETLTQYLTDQTKSRRVQHALAQIAERMERGDPEVAQWYEIVAQLSEHPGSQVRVTAAWVMGHDSTSELFHKALLQMAHDEEVLVRRNAALSLVRFGDGKGLNELRAMLASHTVRAPTAGLVKYLVQEGDWVQPGTRLVQLVKDGERQEVTTELPVQVQGLLVAEGSTVDAGKELLTLSPDPQHVWESLRALSLVGSAAELDLVHTVSENPCFDEEIRKQATVTHQAIQQRLAEAEETED